MPIHAEDLRRYLADTTGRPIILRMNDNTHSLITARPDTPGRGIRLSLHRMFLGAEDAVFRALAQFIINPTPRSRKIIQDFINRNQARIEDARTVTLRRAIRGTPRGKAYHLRERADYINKAFFEGRLRFRIIWGRNIRVGGRQSHVTLGTWNEQQRLIRIHPMLDQDCVPAYFLDYIIFHEMAHIAVPARISDTGRRNHHTREFYCLEQSYPLYEVAMAWEKRWLPKLINCWNRGKQLPSDANDFFAVC